MNFEIVSSICYCIRASLVTSYLDRCALSQTTIELISKRLWGEMSLRLLLHHPRLSTTSWAQSITGPSTADHLETLTKMGLSTAFGWGEVDILLHWLGNTASMKCLTYRVFSPSTTFSSRLTIDVLRNSMSSLRHVATALMQCRCVSCQARRGCYFYHRFGKVWCASS